MREEESVLYIFVMGTLLGIFIMIAIVVPTLLARSEYAYKQGQIDYANGVIKYQQINKTEWVIK